jgi:hypothetical protein
MCGYNLWITSNFYSASGYEGRMKLNLGGRRATGNTFWRWDSHFLCQPC